MSDIQLSPKDSNRIRQNLVQIAARERGMCIGCTKRPSRPGGSYCPDCLTQVNEAGRRLKERRDTEKKCRRCGQLNDRLSGMCSPCLSREREKHQLRLEMRLCTKCGKPAAEDVKLCEGCRVQRCAATTKFKDRLKLETFERYGGCSCTCCKESESVFLTLDHIDGGGNKHRKELKDNKGVGGGHSFYAWLKRNDYPEGYQVLCFNCNFAKWKLGKCPHKSKAHEPFTFVA